MLNINPGSFLRTLSIIHSILFMGLVVFVVWAYYQNPRYSATMNGNDIYTYAVPIFAAFGYFVSQLLFGKQLQKIRREEAIAKKFSKYRVALLIKYALIEGPALFALIAYHVNGNAMFLVIALALIAYFYIQKPTRNKLLKDVPFTLEEHEQINTLHILNNSGNQ